jgi:cardiolipin synthase
MIFVVFHLVIEVICIGHILLRRHRQPESRVAWLVVVLVLPYVGALAYLLLGQTNIGRKRMARLKHAFACLPRPEGAIHSDARGLAPDSADRYAPLFKVGQSISGYPPVGGNRAQLMADSDAAIDEMVADIEQATAHVHLLFYIWLNDHNGTKMVEALKRAAKRGVVCRAMVDDLGSRDLVRSPQWQALAAAGVQTARALQIGNPLLRILDGRIDLRNHRKILVIDNRITYCGSQNCADPAFLIKAKYAPWVDAVMRFEGPVVRQNQHLFASDWMGNGGDDLADILREPLPAAQPGFTAQVIGTGPTFHHSAMPEVFETLIYAARQELVITTPYYVPNSGLQAALCASANRGVATTMIFPARNDDFAVGATCRSYYQDLLSAGVKLYEFHAGLLHTKSLTLDGDITLIGSANMDRRSFELNYENNILLYDRAVTAQMRARQQQYLASSRAITLAEVQGWSMGKRLWNNALAIVGPIL